MPSAPAFKRGDIVYLQSSAALGQIEGYRVTTATFGSKAGSWLYTVEFVSKPPEQATVGDRFDLRKPPYQVYYGEDELLTFCDAMIQTISNLERRLDKIEVMRAGCKAAPPSGDSPRFDIDDLVWFGASAKIGFLETSKITNIATVPAGISSNKVRFVYQVAKKPDLVFGEDELMDSCEAVNAVIASLTGQLVAMKQKLVQCQK